jgi:ribonuclease E
MPNKMLIDASHQEETRVVVVRGNRIEEFDFESQDKKQLRGNIYLARVTRVEPSLQAAFVEYGGNRHGFLAFSEIHPDYYQIPVADRQALLRADGSRGRSREEDEQRRGKARPPPARTPTRQGTSARSGSRGSRARKHYKIQEVIKRRQVMLVQVVKEERGTKGAAMTTYLSLAGRYSVLMPNTSRGGGISRKITDAQTASASRISCRTSKCRKAWA